MNPSRFSRSTTNPPVSMRETMWTVRMSKILYTAKAHVTGGRDGHGRTSDGELDVNLRSPKDMGGDGGGTNPEELFAVGYAACFESALAGVARRGHLDVGEVSIDSSVSLLPTGDGASSWPSHLTCHFRRLIAPPLSN
jgi:Ohr subfamily peroxiredoxin